MRCVSLTYFACRLKSILKTATPRSLVLLDEVGSGTDPVEGAALARAVLDRLAGQSGLTLATTHHAELKTIAEQDSRCGGNVKVWMEMCGTWLQVWNSPGEMDK